MKIHFTGIGGVGMAGLAVLLKERGHDVTGCDVHASARTRWLENQGIPVFIGHDPAHVADVDEVIMTPAVHPDEPERVAAKNRAASTSVRPSTFDLRPFALRFRGEVLADLVNTTDSIAVCGTHGKTTTSTWIAKLLIALGEDVTWCIGGETGDFPVAGRREGVGVRCRCTVDEKGVGVRCRCTEGEKGVGVRCRCTVDEKGVGDRCRCTVEEKGVGVRCRCTAEGVSGSHATGMSRLLCETPHKGDATFLSREKNSAHHRTPTPSPHLHLTPTPIPPPPFSSSRPTRAMGRWRYIV